MGLKGYDLVWVEGRSAAWRYPSEIEELKSFAPIVEEQPFDRFYKRPAPENKSIPKEISPSRTDIAPVVSHDKQYAGISRGDKKVYVTLPARNPAAASASPIKKAIVEEVKPVTIQERFFDEQKFSQPPGFGNEFLQRDVVEKNQRVEKMQQPRLSANKNWLKPAAVILGVFVLLGSGILIGLYINKNATQPAEKTKVAANQPANAGKLLQTNPPQTDPAVGPVSGKLVDNNQTNQVDQAKNNTVKQPESR